MTRAEIATALLDHLRRQPGARGRGGLDLETPLLGGALDSLALIQLIAFVERTWGVRVANHEVVAANFGTVALLATFVESRRG